MTLKRSHYFLPPVGEFDQFYSPEREGRKQKDQDDVHKSQGLGPEYTVEEWRINCYDL